MNTKTTYISKDGLEKLRAELDEMVSVRRPARVLPAHLESNFINPEYTRGTNPRAACAVLEPPWTRGELEEWRLLTSGARGFPVSGTSPAPTSCSRSNGLRRTSAS